MPFELALNPVLFTFFGLKVRYYGLAYFLGFVFAYHFIKRYQKDFGLKLKTEEVYDFMILMILSSIFFARLFYVFVYNLDFYKVNLIEIFKLWHGGMSIHGGLIGGIIGIYIFSRWKGIKILKLTDLVVIPLSFGMVLSRIGNFLNGELYGRITSLPWGVKFPGVKGYRHPSQLYESFKNLVLGLVLFRLRKLSTGYLTASFLIFYGSLRFIVEFFRAPDPQLGFVISWLTMGQLLSILTSLMGFYLFLKLYFSRK